MNLIKNGCFQTPNITVPPYRNNNHPNWNEFIPKPAVAPWTTSAPTFELWHDPTVVNNRPPCYSAPPCKQNCEILSRSATMAPLLQADVWQTVNTKVGYAYTFSFCHTPRPGYKSILTVSINGITVGVFNENGKTPAFKTFKWQKYVVTFIAAMTSTKFNFHDQAVNLPTGGAGAHIDNVALVLKSNTKPLSWSLPTY